MGRDHFLRHPWRPGQEDWHLLATFNAVPEVSAWAAQYEDPLRHHGLYGAVPPEWLHMTVLRVGPTSAISASKMGAVAQRLAAELQGWGPVEVAIGPAWVWGGNVCAHLTPEEPLKDLYEVCSTAFLGLIPAAPKASFLPHVTLAYGRDYTQENELRRTLHSHWIEPVAVVLPSLPLVRERQTPPCYSWEVEAVLPIGISVAAGSRSR